MSDTKEYFTTPFPKTAKATVIAIAAAGTSCLIAGILLLLYFNAKSHLPINTTIHGVAVGNMTVDEAKNTIEKELMAPPLHTVNIQVNDISVASSSSQLQAKYDVDGAILPLVGVPKSEHTRIKVYTVLKRYFTEQTQELKIVYDEDSLAGLLSQLQEKVDIPAEPAQLTLKTKGVPASLSVFTGSIGRAVEATQTAQLVTAAATGSDLTITAPVASIGAVLSEDEATAAIERGKTLVGTSITLTKEGIPFTLTDQEIISFLQLPSGFNTQQMSTTIADWKIAVDRAPQEPEFEYDPETLKVSKFVPPRNGLSLDTAKTITTISEAITELETASTAEEPTKTLEKSLPLAEQPPKKSLAETNDLGIKERIGLGDSYYAHSIPNRIHNVALAANRISLHIVKPGEEFRFNKALGDVSSATGFKSAYVIQGNQTVLGDGGGVCQVSTTLFRAVLDAGLDVTRRLPHSYRVSYYELDRKPGVDATVYSGETDFRFINDTDHHILIYGEADSKNLYMYYEIYGTSDGRTAEIIDHKTWNFRPAPAPQYIPDPSLPPGKLVQVDWAAAGISASFQHVVKDKDGNVIHDDTYVSNYRPWSAKYRQGVVQ